jgi:hypothetical protein
LLTLLLIVAVALGALAWQKNSLHPALIVAGVVLTAGGCAFAPRLVGGMLSAARHVRFAPHALIRRLKGMNLLIRRISLGSWLVMLVLSLVMHALSAFVFALAAGDLGVTAEYWRLGLYYVAMSLVVMLPVSFAGLGAREQVSVLMLGGSAGAATMPMALSWYLLGTSAVHAIAGAVVLCVGRFWPKRRRGSRAAEAGSP